MAAPFPLVNDGFPFRFTFLVELVHKLHRTPSERCAALRLPRRSRSTCRCRPGGHVPFMKRRDRPTAHLLLFAYQNAAGVLHCHGALQRIFDLIQRQSRMSDGR